VHVQEQEQLIEEALQVPDVQATVVLQAPQEAPTA
jgi:hypothetical protein